MYCELEWNDEISAWKCKQCGRIYKASKETPLYAQCRRTLLAMTKNYTRAIVGYVASGMKNRTDEEVEQIFAVCQQCEFFDAHSSSCNKCGCHCNMSRLAVLNKIRMASQHCPEGKW